MVDIFYFLCYTLITKEKESAEAQKEVSNMLVNGRRKTQIILEENEKEILRKAGEILNRILLNADRSEEYIRVDSDSWDLKLIDEMANRAKDLANEEILELETIEDAEY